MTTSTTPPDLIDEGPTRAQFRADVIEALRRTPPHLPPKYFYDTRGSALFEQITELDEYYPTEAEREILRERASEISSVIGPNALIVDAGSHLSKKVEPLLSALESPAGYAPIEISADALTRAVERLHDTFDGLSIFPMVADFTNDIELPHPDPPPSRGVVFFPGSTIGNLEREDRALFLKAFHNLATDHGRLPGALLISTDLHKDPAIIEPAYNDSRGVTAEFNLNVVRRVNAELGGTFDIDQLEHRAVYDRDKRRIEMRLIARDDLGAVVPTAEGGVGVSVELKAGEWVVTEYSHKFTEDGFARELEEAGFRLEHRWLDSGDRFAVNYAVCN